MWHSRAVKAAVRDKVSPQHQLALIMCKTDLTRVCESLRAAFPPSTLHAFAAKANQLKSVLAHLNESGLGCEAASIGEFRQALAVFPPEKVVFDSPAKTTDELRFMLPLPCFTNVDNFQELARVAQLQKELDVKANIGIRINPQVGGGSLAGFSTGTKTSKFGIGLEDSRAELIAAYKAHPFLNMIHVHTGSQGCGLDLIVRGIRATVDLAKEIGDQIKYVDIGGGLPVNFGSDEFTPTFADLSTLLKQSVPELYTDQYTMITEYGRAVAAKSGILLSRVEYTKTTGGRYIITQHAGGDICSRTIWAPNDWPLRLDIYKPNGEPSTATPIVTDVAGPCCNSGDLIAHQRTLPQAEPEDIVVVKDTGAYTYSQHTFYNMRQAPPVYMYDEGTDVLEMVRPAQTVEDSMTFVS